MKAQARSRHCLVEIEEAAMQQRSIFGTIRRGLSGRYQVRVSVRGKQIGIGSFDTREATHALARELRQSGSCRPVTSTGSLLVGCNQDPSRACTTTGGCLFRRNDRCRSVRALIGRVTHYGSSASSRFGRSSRSSRPSGGWFGVVPDCHALPIRRPYILSCMRHILSCMRPREDEARLSADA